MVVFSFSNVAHRQFMKCDPQMQKRIIEKLHAWKSHPSFSSVLEPVINLEPATHRLRIGDYRLLLRKDGDDCFILKVGHRRDVYQ